ncbi:MAG: hypothetical protein Q8O30_13230 [Candidatus Omnitrophota bacterium]|nr:hypothetical protein [Candidatus Omnitrophota bacterium]
MQTQLFNPIVVEIPYEKIYHRLGYRSGVTKLAAQEKDEIERCINGAAALLNLKGTAARIPIGAESTQIILPTGDTFKSKLLFSLLKGCSAMLCMAITAGDTIIRAIESLQEDDLKLGVIYDAVASEMVDAGFEWIQGYYGQELARENLCLLTKRISCGYGDFSIKYQKVFYELLKLKSLGVTMTEAYMLIPEKTATAVTGIT